MNPESMIALSALVTSLAALGFSIYFGWSTRDHNRRSVKPLPYMAPSNYEDQISVRLWNYGSGPMVLKRVVARSTSDGLSGHLIDLVPLPPDGLSFDGFVRVQPGRALPPGECLTLIQLGVKDNDSGELQYIDVIRDFLSRVVTDVEYTDIYDSGFPVYSRNLESFYVHRSYECKERLGDYL